MNKNTEFWENMEKIRKIIKELEELNIYNYNTEEFNFELRYYVKQLKELLKINE